MPRQARSPATAPQPAAACSPAATRPATCCPTVPPSSTRRRSPPRRRPRRRRATPVHPLSSAPPRPTRPPLRLRPACCRRRRPTDPTGAEMINPRGTRRRLALSVVVVFAIVAVFVVRLIDIQVVRAADLNEEADSRRTSTVTTWGVRGSIVDADGTVLADSVERFDITASPKNVKLDLTYM